VASLGPRQGPSLDSERVVPWLLVHLVIKLSDGDDIGSADHGD
jgi:hypothetical protein